MSALTEARDTREILCNTIRYSRIAEIASGTAVYPGAMVALNSSGKAIPAADSANLTVVGVAEAVRDGKVEIVSGAYLLDNGTSTEALTVADLNKEVFVVDDHTVGKVGGSNCILAGILRDVITSGGVVVEVGNGPVITHPVVVSGGTVTPRS